MSEWISVDNKKPKYGEMVIVCSKEGNVQNSVYFLDGWDDEPDWWQDSANDYNPIALHHFTHWMPLPEPPKDGE